MTCKLISNSYNQKRPPDFHLKTFIILLNVTVFLAEKKGFAPPDLLQSKFFMIRPTTPSQTLQISKKPSDFYI